MVRTQVKTAPASVCPLLIDPFLFDILDVHGGITVMERPMVAGYDEHSVRDYDEAL